MDEQKEQTPEEKKRKKQLERAAYCRMLREITPEEAEKARAMMSIPAALRKKGSE